MADTIKNAVMQQKQPAPGKTLQGLVKSMQGEIAKALPSVITPERFTRMALSTISSNEKLQKCDPNSFLAAMMQAAQLGLEPNTPLGQAYIIPYGNSAQFQLGYKGMLDLVYRSGEVELVQAHIVYENDIFEVEYGLAPKLKHIPADGDRGLPVKVYAMFKTKSGGYGFEVMTMAECKQHADKYSKSAGDSKSPWNTSFEEMAKKTVLKRVLKYAPIKTEFARGLAADETIKTSISEDMLEVKSEYTDIEVDADGVIKE